VEVILSNEPDYSGSED